MEYHTFRTGMNTLEQLGILEMYGLKDDADAARMMLADGIREPIAYRHAYFVDQWDRLGRPERCLDPLLIQTLSETPLELPGERLQAPEGLQHLLLRLPSDVPHALAEGPLTVRSLFISFQPCNRDLEGGPLENGFVVGIDVGEEAELGPAIFYPIFTLRAFPLDERPISDVWHEPEFESLNEGWDMPIDLLDRCTRVAVGYCFFHQI